MKKMSLVFAAIFCLVSSCTHSTDNPVMPSEEDIWADQIDTLHVFYDKPDDMFDSPYGFYIKNSSDGEYYPCRIPIYNFPFEKGYYYTIEALYQVVWENGLIVECRYLWQKTLSKQWANVNI